MSPTARSLIVAAAALAAAALATTMHTRPAAAQVACDSLTNPLYLQIGDTQEPLIKALGRKMVDAAGNPIQLVYIKTGSCTNIAAIYSDTLITSNPFYVPSTVQDPAWTTTMPSPTCTIDPVGHAIDVANSALFVSSCDPSPTPAGLALFQGPVQAYLMVVPEASTQTAITAEEAYFVFGFGDMGMAQPWTDETLMFIRPSTKSTLLTWAAILQIPADAWQGVRLDQSSAVLNAVATSTNPEPTIGLLGAEIYDGNRGVVNALAFQTFQQYFAYYADSTSTSFDKQNVRDGHYVPWSPTVWITHVDGVGVPTDPDAEYLINLILGNDVAPLDDLNALTTVIQKGLVPDCAMQVTRSYEGGPLSLYDPLEPCSCFYESVVDTVPAQCTACVDDTPCGTGKCRHGFCEAR